MKGKEHIGKFVCYGEEDGSFSWGRIKDEGFVNTPDGEKEVFILTDRMTCRVPKGELEKKSWRAVSRKIGAGSAGPIKLPGRTDPSTLPEYQRFGDCKKLPAKSPAIPVTSGNLPAISSSTPEGQGLVPDLGKEMGIMKVAGLPIAQKAGSVIGSSSGQRIDYLLRKYGYDTNVRKDKLNLETDVVDMAIFSAEDLTDDELFLLAMQAKLQDAAGRLNQGMKNIIMLNAGGSDEDLTQQAVDTLKKRRNKV